MVHAFLEMFSATALLIVQMDRTKNLLMSILFVRLMSSVVLHQGNCFESIKYSYNVFYIYNHSLFLDKIEAKR